MSKIGKQTVDIPEGVEVKVEKDAVKIKGPNAVLEVAILPGIKVEIQNGGVVCSPKNSLKQTRSNWGTMRSLIQSAVAGSKEDFVKTLIVEGVGYRASVEGGTLIMNLGFSHPVKLLIPEGIKLDVDGGKIKVSGADKAQVGEVAANIRHFKKPEPYKGKGIRYEDEVVRRKAGKKAVGTV